MSGTSPRMRGKPGQGAVLPALTRNIPAYAGKTWLGVPCPDCSPEHPRVCGENRRGSSEVGFDVGTSPRMRGKQKFQSRPVDPPRNIPAYAGKTNLPYCGNRMWSEHPRVCGYNPLGGSGRKIRLRNIPAYAGKTYVCTNTTSIKSEHPRVCGENEKGVV